MRDKRPHHEHELRHVETLTPPAPDRPDLRGALGAAFLPLHLLGVILARPHIAGAPVHPMMYYRLGLYAFMGVAAVWPEPRRRGGEVGAR